MVRKTLLISIEGILRNRHEDVSQVKVQEVVPCSLDNGKLEYEGKSRGLELLFGIVGPSPEDLAILVESGRLEGTHKDIHYRVWLGNEIPVESKKSGPAVYVKTH